MLRDAGASEVHLRIVSPEILWPCFYGIDTGNRSQLISANMTRDEVRSHIGCDSLAFISLNGLRSAICTDHDGFCDACFSGDYPVAIPDYVKRKAEMNQKGQSPMIH
jgi:amidophosphoribosyltransferase